MFNRFGFVNNVYVVVEICVDGLFVVVVELLFVCVVVVDGNDVVVVVKEVWVYVFVL